MILLKKTIMLVAFSLFIISCGKENSVTDYKTFIKENEHTDFSIFEGWQFIPRDPSYYIVNYCYLSYIRDDIDTIKDINLSTSFVVNCFNSISISTELNDENDIVRFCKIKNITRSDFNKYYLEMIHQFLNLKVRIVTSAEPCGYVYIVLNDSTFIAKGLPQSPRLKPAYRLKAKEFTKIDDTWYVRIDSVSHKNSD